jgi:hypothetical protein
MAISAPTKSVQYTLMTNTPSERVKGYDWGAKLRVSYAKLTFTAAGTTTASAGDISLIKLPKGFVRVYGYLSRLICPAGTATADLDLGWAAYVNQAGSTVSADGDGIAASLDVGGGAIAQDLDDLAPVFEFDSQAGVDIVCSFDTANSPASGDLILVLVYGVQN